MLIKEPEDEILKKEQAFKIIRSILDKEGREAIYDLTGLAGGFPIKKEDKKLLETYIGPAIYEKKLEKLALEHLGGEKAIAFNRTTTGILATIIALTKPREKIIHYLPESPSHPSIPESAKIRNTEYLEFDNIKKFHIPEKTSLIFITGATMDHKIIKIKEFKRIISLSKEKGIPTIVDDASGARLRTIIFKQPTAIQLGADLAITSTDKLMNGPRGGILAGKTELINKIKRVAYQFGLEAQPPLIAAMVRALEEFKPSKLLRTLKKRDELHLKLKKSFKSFEKTPTGVMIRPEKIKKEIQKHQIKTPLSPKDTSYLWSMILLKEHGIITIPAAGMPGASPTLRLDLSAADAQKLEPDQIVNILEKSFQKLLKTAKEPPKAKKLLLGG
ncbi:MAG TPA: TIGR03576 family pyridoxal phosphate-dependent enzyme [Methanothermobacter sp.]|nr:TIGR03576 family pyridoxal phosphate-dependent enzyme [Methanothermobacter sp.]HOK72367.1 TIGR03576 family pyridoxal phosphate-dependent enzyme [Methanothermobacter sp.]